MEPNGNDSQEPKPKISLLVTLANLRRANEAEIAAAKKEGRAPVLKEYKSASDSIVVAVPPKDKEVAEIKAPAAEALAIDDAQPWLTSAEAAAYLGLSVKGLRNLASAGKVPHYKLFQENRFNRSELKALLVKVETD